MNISGTNSGCFFDYRQEFRLIRKRSCGSITIRRIPGYIPRHLIYKQSDLPVRKRGLRNG